MNFKLISFYADVDGSTFYSDSARQMINDCKQLEIDYHIEELKTQGDYFKNTFLKPQYILDCLEKFKMPVLWVDVDSKIHKKPELHDSFKDIDISGVQRPFFRDNLNGYTRERNIFVSPLYFNYNENTIYYLKEWIENVKDARWEKEGDHAPFLEVLEKHKVLISNFLPMQFSYNETWVKNRKFGNEWQSFQKRDAIIETVLAPTQIIKSKKTEFKPLDKNKDKSKEIKILNENPNKLRVNIFDKNFINAQPTSVFGKNKAQNVEYVKQQNNFNGISIFTDKCFSIAHNINSKIKIAWQVESPFISNTFFYYMLQKYENVFDYVFTYDQKLIDNNPEKFKPVNFGGTTVHECKMYPKSKEICIVHSGKNATANHRLRKKIIEKYPSIDVFGHITGTPFKYIEDCYADYRFVVVIENGNHLNYFTEKITDAMACGCVPIYNGCLNINESFDSNGIITFRTLDDLDKILPTLNEKLYQRLFLPSLVKNFNIVKNEYYTNEDWLYNNYLKEINEKT